MNKILLGAMLLAAAGVCAAQQFAFKYQRPDGSFIYSDKPIKGAKLIEKIPLDPPTPLAPQPILSAPPPSSSGVSERARARSAAISAADAEVREARQAVDQARERLQQGVEPLPGERVGNANGTSRLREEYFDRVQQLEQDLKDALARLDEAFQRRNEVR
jgi:hypothetical protein